MLVHRDTENGAKVGGSPVYEVISPPYRQPPDAAQYHRGAFEALGQADAEVYDLIGQEYERQRTTLQLIAAENRCSAAVLGALGSTVQNKTTEGFVGGRFHGGCEVVDRLETLAVERAKQAFAAKYANVQPHSGTGANQIVMAAVMGPGDRVLSLGMDQGGHVSHGAAVSFGGKFFSVEHYYVDRQTYLLDYKAIRAKATAFKPKLIICGASAYSRQIDFAAFRRTADEAGAYLMADISHIAGLVIAGAHPSPVDQAHFTTTSTYKPGGPRGGLILMGRDYDRTIEAGGKTIPLWLHVQKTTFPGVQGTPCLNNVAAKAVFLKEAMSAEYRQRQFRIIENARALAQAMEGLGYEVLTGGTDNHIVMVDAARSVEGMTGIIAQKALEECGIVVNMNRLPYDPRSMQVTSGVRLGTPIVTRNGMGPEQMGTVAELVDAVLRKVEVLDERQYHLDEQFRDEIRERVLELCLRFPMA